ncbi:hypothetical protein [Sulfobacillus harzensis]|uniref:Uncharacterized protein n=1 Tax=Sulfobacillus harzensis TaxID=2729629 RepID=A0A7Y0Q549_9FIRM|nr:hypothetical protein [Sulfobacillus harzensis]NMP23899.1 hypothetical protein [Sulfobacillus harzensis]
MSTYQLAVNERRLLAEFPAFFHSFEEMLTELTQNVSRVRYCVYKGLKDLKAIGFPWSI